MSHRYNVPCLLSLPAATGANLKHQTWKKNRSSKISSTHCRKDQTTEEDACRTQRQFSIARWTIHHYIDRFRHTSVPQLSRFLSSKVRIIRVSPGKHKTFTIYNQKSILKWIVSDCCNCSLSQSHLMSRKINSFCSNKSINFTIIN